MDKPTLEVIKRQQVARPIAVYSQAFEAGEEAREHRHPRGQLLWPASGAIRVRTPSQAWIVPAERAIWLPPSLAHGFTATRATVIHTLYVEAGAVANMPAQARAVATSGLLRELLMRALSFPLLYAQDGAEGMVMALILAEIGSLPALPLAAPMPDDPRLRGFAEAVLAGDLAPLADWPLRLALTPRTFVRRFQAETGLTPAAFHKQARMLAALKALSMGASVTAAGLDAGYETSSAFIDAFRAAFGETPGAFARRV